MEKYRRVSKPKEATPDGEVRVTATGRVAAYVTYVAKLIQEDKREEIVVKATGTALAKAVTLAEIAKRRFKGLSQLTKCGNSEIVDEFEPLEEGLDRVVRTRSVSYIEITLSTGTLDSSAIGYQAALPEDQVTEYSAEDNARPRSSGKGSRKGRKGAGKGKSEDRSGSKSAERKEGDSGRKGKGKGKGKGKKTSDDAEEDTTKVQRTRKPRGESNDWESWGASWDDWSWGKGKGKGKGKDSKGKGKGKGKGKDDWYAAPSYDYYYGGSEWDWSWEAPKGKGKGKGKGGKGKY